MTAGVCNGDGRGFVNRVVRRIGRTERNINFIFSLMIFSLDLSPTMALHASTPRFKLRIERKNNIQLSSDLHDATSYTNAGEFSFDFFPSNQFVTSL